MGKLSSLLYGLGLGAGLMYFLDPQHGNRRQAMVRDQIYHMQNKGDEAVQTGVRDLRNRTRGILAEGMGMLSQEGIPDHLLEERIRARLGFLTRHPSAVQVSVQNKKAVLAGDVLQNEVDHLVSGVRQIRGIEDVQSNLNVHQEAGNVPQLQGEGWMPGQDNQALWTPAARLLASIGAAYLVLSGLIRGGFTGTLSTLGGVLLGSRALTNMDMRSLTGVGEGQSAIRVRKSIKINAPIDQVYRLWSNFENFPQFMSNVQEVRDIGNQRSHWVVKGPAGSSLEWDAVTTDMRENEIVSWETEPDSQVKHNGQVTFRESGGGTQINVMMSYLPPAGAAGHAVATLMGKDPKSQMDSDLARMKSLLEEGKTTSKQQKVRQEHVMPVTGEHKEESGEFGEQIDTDLTDLTGQTGISDEGFMPVTGEHKADSGEFGEQIDTDLTDLTDQTSSSDEGFLPVTGATDTGSIDEGAMTEGFKDAESDISESDISDISDEDDDIESLTDKPI